LLANYYTLKAVTRELNEALVGIHCYRAYCFRKDELRIQFANGDTIVALLTPVRGALYLSHNPERLPRKNVASFFPEVSGLPLKSVSMSPQDREITLDFGEYKLQLRFYGSPNAVLSQGDLAVTSFKKLKPENRNRDEPSSVTQLDLLGKRLKSEYEAAQSSGSDKNFLQTLEEPSGVWVYELPENVLLSPIELHTGIENAVGAPRFFAAPSEGVRKVLQERHSLGKFRSAAQALLPKIEQTLARTLKAIDELERAKTQTSRADDSEAIGKALLGKLSEIPRGASKISVDLPEGSREIKLDPKLTSAQNADRYFDRAKRSRDAQVDLRDRRTALERERTILERLKEQAAGAEGTSELEKLSDAFTRLLNQTVFDDARAKSQADDPLAKFRQFTVAGGMRVLIGKSAAQNDELTLHVAKKNDIWLHARGVKGSHGVLQVTGKRDDVVPREAIRQAAEIVAYFSDARTQSLAPVSYTEAKYVRKPRKAEPGAVVMQREEVMMVCPALPK
jgi:predicted ribosome quality control (RQC) complex YloA/Tae2 family protein